MRVLTGPINTDFDTLRASGQLAETYAEVAASRPVLEGAIDEVGADVEPAELQEVVNAVANEITRIVRIRVRDNDPARAAAFANAIARELTQLDTLGQNQPAGRLQVIDPARVPSVPVAPKVELIAILATLASIVGAAILAVFLDRASSVASERDLLELGDVKFLGAVDGDGSIGFGRRDSVRGPRSSDAYRLLAAKLGLSTDERQPARTVLVTSVGEASGSGIFAGHLASAIAGAGRRVTLVDADATTAEITKQLRLEDRRGYTDLAVANGAAPKPLLDELTVPHSKHLGVVPRGTEDADVAGAAERLLESVRRLRGGVVVVAAPPVARSAEALSLARLADMTILVVRQGRTSREHLDQALQSLSAVDARLAGAALLRTRLFARMRAPRQASASRDQVS